MKSFTELQSGLAHAWAANRPGSSIDHVLIVLPSFSLGESLLSHYGKRIPAIEHRYLLTYLLLARIERCEIIYVSCQPPSAEVIDYYTSLLPSNKQGGVRERFHLMTVPDLSARSVAAKLLDRPDLLKEMRSLIGNRPAFIEPWNVTEDEVEVSLQLQAPINGSAPELLPLGYKSSGRKLIVDAGVPVPFGYEDVRTVEDVIVATVAVRTTHPSVPAVVLKHDDSGAGDGNVVIDLTEIARGDAGEDELRRRIEVLPEWYLRNLAKGGVVEELIAGVQFASPSVQVDITPTGEVIVLATHEQALGGESGQIYMGCQFPANPAYAKELAQYGQAVGQLLAYNGALGRFSLDFAAALDAHGDWQLYALEINLRKGGTSHPYAALRNLIPGRYDAEAGQWIAADGTTRSYYSTDNVVEASWIGLPPAIVIHSIAERGLQFDYQTGTGIVLHMLSCLAIDGRFGLTAFGMTPDHAAFLYAEARAAVALGAAGLRKSRVLHMGIVSLAPSFRKIQLNKEMMK